MTTQFRKPSERQPLTAAKHAGRIAQDLMVWDLNDHYVELFEAAFEKKFGTKCTTRWSVLELVYVSTLADGADFTMEQRTWMEAFSAGYLVAMARIGEQQ